MIILGMTGSIGMGKSTTAEMFRTEGIPVHDSDAAVHNLYRGKAAPLIEAEFPGTVTDGSVDRSRLGSIVIGNSAAMRKLESIVHPLVAEDRDIFLNEAREIGAPLVVFDVPLLYETGGDKLCDKVLVVTASADVQRQRVLARPGMTVEKLEAILASQMPDAEKRRRADFLVDTGMGMPAASATVRWIVARLCGGRQMSE